jgi:hypothetical protein
MNLMNKLTSYASLIGVIVAIGGGFYAWGEFNTRLDAIESKKVISLAPINNQVLELRNSIADFKESVSVLEVTLIDRIDALREKVEEGNEVDLSELSEQIDSLAENINADLDAMKETLTKVDKEVSIALKENELQDEKIEAVRLKATNPLATN